MRLRLSKRFFAALMAAITSVTFTSAGTATLGAAAFTFSMQQAAAAEQIDTTASSNTETAVSVDASGDKKASEDEESEEVEAEEELLEPDSTPIASVGSGGAAGSGAAGYSQGGAENVGNLDDAPQQQAGAQSASPSASLPSDDLGFTTNSYANSIAEALADVETPSVPAAIAAELELATPAKPTSSESSSSSNGSDAPLASGSFAPMGTSSWFGSSASNSFAPVSQGLSSSNLPLTLLGDASPQNLVWDNHAGDNKWSGSLNWHTSQDAGIPVPFTDGDNVTFDGVTDTATLSQATTAGTMTVKNAADVTIEGDYGLTLNSLSVTGSSVSFAGHVTVTGGATIEPSGNATIAFHDGFSFTQGGGKFNIAVLINGGNRLILGGKSNLSNKNIAPAKNGALVLEEGATVDAMGVRASSGDVNNNGSVSLGQNASLTTESWGIVTPQLSLEEGSSLNLNGQSNNNMVVKLGTISGSGDINFTTGAADKTYEISGDITGWTGKLDNKSATDVTVSLGSSSKNVNMDIASTGTGKVNLKLSSTDYTFGGNVAVNNINQPATASLFVADGASVTATGTVQTGRLVVGENEEDARAQFTLSGDNAMLSKVASQHTYDGVVEGYGTLTLANGATQTFTGDLDGYYGDFVSDGHKTVLTLNSGKINTAADIIAQNSGTLALGGNVDTLGSVTIDGYSTLALSRKGDAALTFGSLTMDSGSVLDLSTLGLTGKEVGDIVLAHSTGAISDVSGVIVDFGLDSDISTYTLSAKDGDLVINFDNLGRDLVWRTESGTWTGTNAWCLGGTDKLTTFQDGDSVTIAATDYEAVSITMFKDADASTMTVKDAAEGLMGTTVTISDDQTGNFRLGVQRLVLEENTNLMTNTRMEVAKSVRMQDVTSWTINSPQDSTISADISSVEDPEMIFITKMGESTLTLTGDNSGYNGMLTVWKGTLVAKSTNALGSGVVSVEDGATLSLERKAAMYAESLTLSDGSTIAFVGDTLLNVDSLTLGSSNVTWDLSKYGFSGTESDILIQGVTMDPDSAAYLASTLPTNINTPNYITGAGLIYDATAHTVALTYTMPEDRTLYWQGGAGNWTAAPNQKLVWHPSQDTAERVAFQDFNSVVFDDRASLSFVTLADETLHANNVTVDNGTMVVLVGSDDNNTLVASQINVNGDLVTRVNVEAGTVAIDEEGSWRVDGDTNRVFDGKITGDGTLTKSGYSDLALSGDNSGFHGNVMIDAGSVTVGSESALGTNSSIHMENDTIVQGADTTTLLEMGGNTLSVDAADAEAMVATNMNVATGSDITFAGAGKLDLTGNISGNGSLVKNGFGTVEILGNATYTGDTTVNAGTLAFAGGFTSGNDFTVEIGGGLKLGEQAQGQGGDNIVTYKDGKEVDKSAINFVTGGKLTLKDGVYLDLANVHLKDGVAGVAKFASLDAIFADEIGDPEDSYYYQFIEGVSLLNVEGTGGTTYARLAYDVNNELLYVQTFGGTNGAYWKGDANTGEGLWFRHDKGAASQWRTAQNGTIPANYDWSGKKPMSAYFFELTDSDGNTIDETTVTIASSMPGEGQDGNHPSYGAGDVIIDGKTKYVFKGTMDDEHGEESYLNLNGQYPTALIVRAGAQAEFKTGITAQNGSLWQVEEGAAMTIDTSSRTSTYSHEAAADYVQLYNVINDGTMDMFVGSTWFKHVVNNGEMSLTAYEDVYGVHDKGLGGSIYVTTIYNAQDATLTLAGEALTADSMSTYLGIDNDIKNEGLLVFNGTDRNDSKSNEFVITVPIVGTGVVRTGEEEDSDAEVLFSTWRTVTVYDDEDTHEHLVYGYVMGSSTVENSALELGANITTFEEGVNITDSTTVYSGKHANFYGGGILDPELPDVQVTGMLGDVTLQAGTPEDATELVFGPKAVYELNEIAEAYEIIEYTNTDYLAGQVVAGENSTLEVERGATVEIDDFNAGTFATPTGEIKMGTFRDTMTQGEDASLTIKGAAAVDTITMVDNAYLVVEGNANINLIMQGGGTNTSIIELTQDSTLNGKHDEAHGEALTGGTVTGGTLVLDENVTLTQNAVVDVRNNGTYTVAGDPTSKIDASNLELIVDETTTYFNEVIPSSSSVSENQSLTRSGFKSAGDEYVKLFDIVYTGEGDEKHNLTHLISGYEEDEHGATIRMGESIYHSEASGMMTLIGDDNYGKLQEGLPKDSKYIMKDMIGYGYLHTQKMALQTYYVHDLYTESVVDPEDDQKTLEAERVKLSQIIEASKENDVPQLTNVVFDLTERNRDYTDDGPYNGTLTVDANKEGDYTKADLFSVASDTKAAINIAAKDGDKKEVVVLADEHYVGVSGSLDLEGDGVYQINNRNDLGTKVSVRDNEDPEGKEWDGTVRVTGTSTDLYIDNMYAGAGDDASTIEFNHWNGALDEGNHTVDAKILLTGTGSSKTDTAAMTLTGAEDINYTFTNTVTGDNAQVNHVGEGNVALTFEGDTSAWDGRYQQNTNTNDSLTFSGGETVNAGVFVVDGNMDLTYDDTVTTVAGNVELYSLSNPTSMDITYNGTNPMTVSGGISSDRVSDLTINVGDGKNEAAVTFTGAFSYTDNATMAVKKDATSTIDTDATLLRVVGDTNSTVNVEVNRTLELTSSDQNTYSEFHNLDNDGTIKMQADGGDIKLVDDTTNGNTYEMGNLVLVDPAGTASIETSGVEGKTTTVNIDSLTGPNSRRQVLELTNDNGLGTVDYNLGGNTNFTGTVRFGSDEPTGDANVVLNSNDVAANAVLQSTGTSSGEASVVVNAGDAHVLGIDSTKDSTVGGKVYGTKDESTDPNRQVTITGDGTYSYNGGLGENLDIAYTGSGKQTFEGGATGFNGAVTVDNGDDSMQTQGVLEILNASEVNVTDLLLGENDLLRVQNGGANGSAVVSASVVAEGGSTSNNQGSNASKYQGNLTLNSGASYDVSAAGGQGGLDLAGSFTINEGASLSAGDIELIYQMKIGEKYDLAFDVTSFNGFEEELSIGSGAIDANTLFGNQFWEGEYYVCYSGFGTDGGNGDNVGTVYLYRATPEPTTSTLSLLALAALAARRRRKG